MQTLKHILAALLYTIVVMVAARSYARDDDTLSRLQTIRNDITYNEVLYMRTNDESAYKHLMQLYNQEEAILIDMGNCPFIESKHKDKLCQIWRRNVFIPNQKQYGSQSR